MSATMGSRCAFHLILMSRSVATLTSDHKAVLTSTALFSGWISLHGNGQCWYLPLSPRWSPLLNLLLNAAYIIRSIAQRAIVTIRTKCQARRSGSAHFLRYMRQGPLSANEGTRC